MTDNDNEIDALLRHLNGEWIVGTDKEIDEMYNGFASALTALVKERDVYRTALMEIANQDYRGNGSHESHIARHVLAAMRKGESRE